MKREKALMNGIESSIFTDLYHTTKPTGTATKHDCNAGELNSQFSTEFFHCQ